jgi:hypothetical protein
MHAASSEKIPFDVYGDKPREHKNGATAGKFVTELIPRGGDTGRCCTNNSDPTWRPLGEVLIEVIGRCAEQFAAPRQSLPLARRGAPLGDLD